MNQKQYEKIKREVQGFYFKFNTTVLKWNMSKIFNYSELIETAKDFENFEDYFKFHMKGKDEVLNEVIDNILNQYSNEFDNLTSDKVYNCIAVRLGNVYTGNYIENKIIQTINNLENWIVCEKTDKDTDTFYKVDSIITVAGIDNFAIQIKPISFTTYDKGSESSAHTQFSLEKNMEVYYVFYKDRENIIFNNTEVNLNNKVKLVEIIESLVYSS